MLIRIGVRMRLAASLALATVVGATAQSQAPESQAPARTDWTAEDALPLTCAQAWAESGKTYKGMLTVVKTLAVVSLANRDLEFPDTSEAGMDAGKGIVADCKADPDALLFAIVDKHVRRVAQPSQ